MEEDDFINLHRNAKADPEESDQLGDQLIKVQSCQAKRAVVPKRLIQLLGRCLLVNILRTFSQNTFMVGRNEIHRRYPKHEYHSCAVRTKTILFKNGQDCRTRLARPNSQARTGTGNYSFSLFS